MSNKGSQESSKRRLQLIIWGATGVVGRLVAEHLARDYQGRGIKWGLGGRNLSKLEAVRKDVTALDPSLRDMPLLVADVKDLASLVEMTSQAKVVLATAGPYAKFGTPVVEACIETGTHYCDVTGETAWVRRMIQLYDIKAKEKGVKIVHMAGFDSTPSDLAAFTLSTHIRTKYGKGTERVEVLYDGIDGPVSGGSIISLMGLFFEEQGDGRTAITDPYGLDPPTSSRGPDEIETLAPGYSKLQRSYYAPFVMAPINSRVVRRSNALLGSSYGENFSYSEYQKASGLISAFLATFLQSMIFLLCSISMMRGWLLKKLPKPGDMPERKEILGHHWTGSAVAVPEGSTDASDVVKMEMKGFGDAGYWTTSRMLLEAGLCLALQEDDLKAAKTVPAGILTPASALGKVLLDRINNAPSILSFRIVGKNS